MRGVENINQALEPGLCVCVEFQSVWMEHQCFVVMRELVSFPARAKMYSPD